MLRAAACRRRGAVLAVILLSGVSAVGQRTCAQSLRWTSDRVRVNGIPIELRSAMSVAQRATVAAGLSRLWRVGEADGAVLADTRPLRAGETLIGRQRGSLHEVVRLRDLPGGGTDILVAVTDLARPPARLPQPPFPLTGRHRLLSVIELTDARGARLFVAQAAVAPASMPLQLRRSLEAAGWAVRRAGSATPGQVVWASRGRERLEAVVLPMGAGSRLVLQVSADGP